MRLSLLLLPLAFVSSMASANDCSITVTSSDTLTYSLRSITVPASCDEFTVNFEHKGRMPKTAMGHNWVLTQTSNLDAVVDEGKEAGRKNDFLPPNDSRIIAATPIIGGGEKASVSFNTSELSSGEDYTYFCSFPGHWSMMRGKLKLAE